MTWVRPHLAAFVGLLAAACSTGEPKPYAWEVPVGTAPPPTPADNPQTVEKVELGRHLFYELRLSSNQDRYDIPPTTSPARYGNGAVVEQFFMLYLAKRALRIPQVSIRAGA